MLQQVLGEWDLSRLNNLVNPKVASLLVLPETQNDLDWKSFSYWTGNFTTSEELLREQLYDIQALAELQDGRSFEPLFKVGFDETQRYGDELKALARDILARHINLWSLDQLDHIMTQSERRALLPGSKDFNLEYDLLSVIAREAKQSHRFAMGSPRSARDDGVNYISQNYKEAADGFVRLNVFAPKKIFIDPVTDVDSISDVPFVPFVMLSRLGTGIYSMFRHGIPAIPETVAGLLTGGAYGTAGKNLGQQTAVVAMLPFALKGGFNLFQKTFRSPTNPPVIQSTSDGSIFSEPPVTRGWGEPVWEGSSEGSPSPVAFQAPRYDGGLFSNPEGPVALLAEPRVGSLTETSVFPFEVGPNFTFVIPELVPVIPIPFYLSSSSRTVLTGTEVEFTSVPVRTVLEVLPFSEADVYWMCLALENEEYANPPSRRRIAIYRFSEDGQLEAVEYYELNEDEEFTPTLPLRKNDRVFTFNSPSLSFSPIEGERGFVSPPLMGGDLGEGGSSGDAGASGGVSENESADEEAHEEFEFINDEDGQPQLIRHYDPANNEFLASADITCGERRTRVLIKKLHEEEQKALRLSELITESQTSAHCDLPLETVKKILLKDILVGALGALSAQEMEVVDYYEKAWKENFKLIFEHGYTIYEWVHEVRPGRPFLVIRSVKQTGLKTKVTIERSITYKGHVDDAHIFQVGLKKYESKASDLSEGTLVDASSGDVFVLSEDGKVRIEGERDLLGELEMTLFFESVINGSDDFSNMPLKLLAHSYSATQTQSFLEAFAESSSEEEMQLLFNETYDAKGKYYVSLDPELMVEGVISISADNAHEPEDEIGAEKGGLHTKWGRRFLHMLRKEWLTSEDHALLDKTIYDFVGE